MWCEAFVLCVCQIYLHPFRSVFVVKLHGVARLDPADRPALFTGHRRHQDPSGRAEMRRAVAQHHAGGLVDAGGVRVDGGVHLQNHDAVPETLGFASDALNTAHDKQHERPAEHQPSEERTLHTLTLRRTHTTHTDPQKNAHYTHCVPQKNAHYTHCVPQKNAH